jgi:hypothetical protein
MYHFEVSRTALYPLRYVPARTSTFHLVLPCTSSTRGGPAAPGTGFQMGSRWILTTSPTARRPSPPSSLSGRQVEPYPVLRPHRRAGQRLSCGCPGLARPTDGWQHSTVARLCQPARGAFSHVVTVAYSRQTSALRGTADSESGSLLDARAASYGVRWVLLSPAAAAGVSHDPPEGPGRRPLASIRVSTPRP